MNDKFEKPFERGSEADDDLDLDKIVKDAVHTVNNSVPSSEITWKARLAIFFAALIVVANSVIGIYNSVLLRQEVDCNHRLNIVLNTLSDQSRDITKHAIDAALGGTNPRTGKPLTQADLIQIKKTYDEGFVTNTKSRADLLRTTCNNGGNPPAPSGSSTSPAK